MLCSSAQSSQIWRLEAADQSQRAFRYHNIEVKYKIAIARAFWSSNVPFLLASKSVDQFLHRSSGIGRFVTDGDFMGLAGKELVGRVSLCAAFAARHICYRLLPMSIPAPPFSTTPVSLLWLRQDLRLSDHPALAAGMAEGAVVPVYILDDEGPGAWRIGAAQRWWLHHSLMALGQSYAKRGSALILRRGESVAVLRELASELGINRIHAIRHHEPWHRAAESGLAKVLDLVLHEGNQLVDPRLVLNGAGERYRVFTPWFRRLCEMMPPLVPLPAPDRIPSPEYGLRSERLDAWNLCPRAPDWAAGFAKWRPGEKGAWRRLRDFLALVDGYAQDRDFPTLEATSRLSAHLHFGEISPRAVWHTIEGHSGPGAASFRSEIGWREHGLNLVDQFPRYAEHNGRALFDRLPWREGPRADENFLAWTKGRTGYPVVDAGMRELWQTGWMHNRVRMITASFLVKHLLIDWRRGERWFWDCLLDADLGANAMNWQYVAGSGVDAPVFSRMMAPFVQSPKFAMAGYIRRFVPELAHLDDDAIHAPHEFGVTPADYPQPLISHVAARARAMAAWEGLRAA